MLKTVQKCDEVLSLFTSSSPEWGVTSVSNKLKIPKSSAHSLLSSLAVIGLTRKLSNGRYRLGWRINALNSLLMKTTICREYGHKALQRLVMRFGETTHLGVLDGASVLFLDKLSGTHAVKIKGAEIGDRKPAAMMSIGKALLACEQWDNVLKALRDFNEAIGPSLNGEVRPAIDIDYEELFVALEQVRRDGFATYTSLVFSAVSAPIWDHSNSIVAAISMSSPNSRFFANKAKYIEAVCEAADWSSSQLGAYEPPQKRWAAIRGRVESPAGSQGFQGYRKAAHGEANIAMGKPA